MSHGGRFHRRRDARTADPRSECTRSIALSAVVVLLISGGLPMRTLRS